MSLILEALRKSEAERQLGRPPGLLSPAPALASKRAMRWWVVPAVLVLLAVGVGSWWLGRQGAATDAATSGVDAPAAPDSASAAIEAAPTAPAEAAATRPVAAVSTKPVSPTVRTPESSTEPAPKPTTDLPPPAPLPTPAPTSTAASPEPAAPPTVVSHASELRIPLARIEHMPAADRARLPALKLSVHLFAEQSDRRFAIIDGRRVTDEDKLADDLAVKAIVPEGVLLVFEGRTWLLPRP